MNSPLQPASPDRTDCADRTDRTVPVARLCNTLDAIFAACAKFAEPSHSALFSHTLRVALAEAASHPTLLSPAQREGSLEHYRRHLLAADPGGRYAIAALIWLPQQASPVHAHHTWCGYAVLDGTLSETVFKWNDAQHCATHPRTHARERGAVSFVRSGCEGIHRLGNSSDQPAVSLHVYGVSGEQIATHVNDVVRVAADQALA